MTPRTLVFLLLITLVPASVPTLAKERSWAQAKAALLKGLRDQDAHKRAMSVYEIDGFDSPEAARILVRYVLSRDDRAPVIRAGLQLASALRDEKSVATLAAEADEGDPLKRARVLESLGYVPGEVALGAVLKAAYDEDPRVRVSAILALEDHDSGRAEMAAADALDAAEWPVRSAAIEVVRRKRGKLAPAKLIERLAPNGETGRLRMDVLHALRQVTGQDFGNDYDAWKRWLGEPEAVKDDPDPAVALPWRARIADVVTPAKRVLYVLQVSQTMRNEVVFDPARAIPADVRSAGGKALAEWQAVKTKLELAQMWIEWSIDHLAEDAEFNVLTYAVGVNTVFPEFVPATRENREKAKKRVGALSGSGNCDLHGALVKIFTLAGREPLDLENMRGGPETVFFLADGAADWGEIRESSGALGEAERWDRYRQIRFDGIGVGEHDTRMLSELSGLGPGGEYVTLP